MLAQVALFGGAKPYAELPADSALSSQKLQHGDILVFATDGVWDNLSSEDALRIVSRLMLQLQGWAIPEEGSAGVSADFAKVVKMATMRTTKPSATGIKEEGEIKGLSAVLASAITHEAKEASLNEKRDGPFAREVQRLYPEENWRGGKRDDICTVVAIVMKDGA